MPTILAISLDRTSREPLYRQVERHLRLAIVDRRLRPGALLPGVRTLAGQLGVARITIVTAYEQLASEGLLDARIGSGTRVATDADAAALEPGLARPSAPLATPKPIRRVTAAPGRPIDLRPGGVRIDDGPTSTWETLLRGAWRELMGGRAGRARTATRPATRCSAPRSPSESD